MKLNTLLAQVKALIEVEGGDTELSLTIYEQGNPANSMISYEYWNICAPTVVLAPDTIPYEDDSQNFNALLFLVQQGKHESHND